MVLPLILGALGGSLGSAGLLGGIGALGGAALGSGLGGYAQTGNIEDGILTGLGAYAGGALLGGLAGGGAAANMPAAGAGLGQAAIPGGAGAASLPMKASLATVGPAGAPMNVVPSQGIAGIGRGAIDFATSGSGLATGIGGMVGSSFAPMIGGRDSGRKRYSGDAAKEMPAMPRNIQFPGQDYQPGVSPEFDYGFGPPPTAQQITDYRDRVTNPYKMAGGGMIRSLERTFGPIRLAAGGIASLMEDDDQSPEDDDDEVPMRSPMGGNEKDVVVEAVRAIKGESARPEIALGAFLAQYGEQALRDLVDKVQSGEMDDTVRRSEGKMRGAGDGMDDLIPATIEGEQDVLLSDGEFVVPADVVSGLGNGSSDAGARSLEDMMDRVRMAKNGRPEQPKQVPQRAMLPA